MLSTRCQRKAGKKRRERPEKNGGKGGKQRKEMARLVTDPRTLVITAAASGTNLQKGAAMESANITPEAAMWQAQVLHDGARPVLTTYADGHVAPAWAGTSAIVAVFALQIAAPGIQRFLARSLRPRKCRCCYGVGHDLCDTCKGRGKEGGLFTQRELVACATCRGSGHRLCDACLGTGLANHWLYRPTKNPGWGPRGES